MVFHSTAIVGRVGEVDGAGKFLPSKSDLNEVEAVVLQFLAQQARGCNTATAMI